MISVIKSWVATMLSTVIYWPPQCNNPCIALDTSIIEDSSYISKTVSWSVKITTSLRITPIISCIICVIALLVNPPIGGGLPLAWDTLNNNTNNSSFRSVWWCSSPFLSFTTSPITFSSSAILLYSLSSYLHYSYLPNIPFKIITTNDNSMLIVCIMYNVCINSMYTIRARSSYICFNVKYILYHIYISC